MDKITMEDLRALLASSDGDKYIFGDNATFVKEQTITVQAGAHFYNGAQPMKARKEQDDPNEELILSLMPIFMDNEDYAQEFLQAITDKNGLQITNIVKTFRMEKKLSACLCHHSLWKLLHDRDIYKKTERNWNERIKY